MIKFATDYNEKKVQKFLVSNQMRNTHILSLFPKLIVGVFAIFLIIGYPHTWKADFFIPILLLCLLYILIQRPAYRMLYNIHYQDTYRVEGKREYIVDENGIRCHGATQDFKYDWAFFNDSKMMEDFYCFQDKNGQLILCNISQLSPEEFEDLKALADKHIVD